MYFKNFHAFLKTAASNKVAGFFMPMKKPEGTVNC